MCKHSERRSGCPRKLNRRRFLRRCGAASGAIGIGSLLAAKPSNLFAANGTVRVAKVMNGSASQNVSKALEIMGGIGAYIDPTDTVVIKGNAQWPYQGYTHTGCIKALADEILAIPGFSGEIFICDNTQVYGEVGHLGFDLPVDERYHNWPDHNWNSLADEYQTAGQPVAAHRWINTTTDIDGPADRENGWMREYFPYQGETAYLSYPVFQSPLTPGRMIDMQNGVWESGGYTGEAVKTIFMPTLNNHGWGAEDYAGITSAIKCFFGATEIHTDIEPFNGAYNIHAASFDGGGTAENVGELAAHFINNQYAPVLYITAAMWSGHDSREGEAIETNTVLACENPATLDYVACRDVISPHAAFLNPDNDNNTRRQIIGAVNNGIGTITPGEYEIITHDFSGATPTPTPTPSAGTTWQVS